mgnify:CR=1 FL=1
MIKEKEKKEIQKEQTNALKKSLGSLIYIATEFTEKNHVKLPDINTHDDPIFDQKNLNSIHKVPRKTSLAIMYLKKKYNLLFGKASYICGCPRNNINIYVTSDKKGNSSTYGTLKCSSIYQCNLCQQTVLSQRKIELEAIAKQHLETGGGIYLVTLTVKHSKKDKLENLLGSSKTKSGVLGAYNYLISKDRNFKKLLDKYGVAMSCRVFEVTYGVNGYHAHIHSNVYTNSKLSEKQVLSFQKEFYKLWKMSIKKVGLECIEKRAVLITDASTNSSYITKFSSSSELTTNHIKEAKNGNYTINQLENLLLDENQTAIPLKELKMILSDYYKYCYGKRFLTWSDKTGLKKKYLTQSMLEEQSDEEILDSSNIEEKEKICIGNSTYKNIYVQNKVHEFRTSFELDSFDGVLLFAKTFSISTVDVHFLYDLTITEDDKIKRIDYFKTEFDFFPEYGENNELRDYFVLNYHNLLETAFSYYTDKSILLNNNAYYPYVLEFCKQYQDRIFEDNS